MKLYPELYIRPTGSRLSFSSVGKLQSILEDQDSTLINIQNLTQAKTETDGDNQRMADATDMTVAEKIKIELTGIKIYNYDYNELSGLRGENVDVCFLDSVSRNVLVLYRTKFSMKKTAESESAVTVIMTFEKNCTNADNVMKEQELNEVYVTGFVIDDTTQNEVSGAVISCVDPVKSGYSVTSGTHGDYAIEIPVTAANNSTINVHYGSTDKQIVIQAYPGDIITDLEIEI